MRTFKKNTLLFLFFSLTTLIQSYAQTADIASGCAPLSVNFTSPGGLSSHFWDFENGANSLAVNPSAIFTEAGVYEVSLREGNGGPLVGTVTITVFAAPEIAFTVDTTRACRPALLNFADNSQIDPGISITNYSWVFGDGGAGFGENTAHTYTTPGLYDISLSLMTDQQGCDQTAIFPAAVTIGGVLGLNFITNPNPAIACEPPFAVNFINFTPVENITFDWDFDNGSFFNGPNPPVEVFTESGVFNVELLATDSLGCTDSRIRNVRVLEPQLSAGFPDTVCLDQFVYYSDFAMADSVQWTWPSGAVTGFDEFMNPIVIFTEAGIQEINLRTITNTPIFCQSDTTFFVFVDEVIAELTADPTYTCENDITIDFSATSTTGASFSWLFADLESDIGPMVTHTYTYVDTLDYSMNGLNSYSTSLYATNPSGCIDTLFRLDTIYVPNALFMPDVSQGCAPLTVVFSDSSASLEPILTYVYDYGDGNMATFTNDDSHSYTFTEAGTYEVHLRIENEAGCRDTSYIRLIEVGTPLDIEFTYEESVVCVDDTIRYTVIDPPEEVDWFELVEPDTLYTIYNGCLTQTINPEIVVQGPDVKLAYELECDDPYRVQFSSETFEAETLLWEFGDGATSNLPNPEHVYNTTGDFWAKVTAFNPNTGCPAKSDSTLICIRDLAVDFELPDRACLGEQINIDATATVDANRADCVYGFTWMFDLSSRPIMGNDTILPFVFSTPGHEVVTLIAKDVNGCKDTLSKIIDVYSIQPDFVLDDPFVCMPATVNFTDLSVADTTLVSWNWEFGDGEFSNTPLFATHIYTTIPPGLEVPVVLTVEDAQGCSATDTLLLNTYIPISNILADVTPLNICVGETINFTGTQFTAGGSFLAFDWAYGDNETAVGPEVSISYPEAGSFPLSLNYVEVGSGCTGTVSATVNVQDYPVAGFTSSVDDEPIVCAPAQITFNTTSEPAGSLNFNWNFGNGSFSNAPNPITSFERGAYDVTLVAFTSFGCADTIVQNYEVVGPAGSFTFGPQAICQGETVTFELVDTMDVSSFSWDLGDGTVISDVNPLAYTYENVPVLGNRPVVLTLRGADDACEFSVTDNILIQNVRADFSLGNMGDSILCSGSYTLNNESVGANSFSWELPDGSMPNSFEPSFTVAAGTYTITLAVEDTDLGCVDELSQTFTFVTPTSVQAFGDTICPGDTAQLTIIGVEDDWDFLWNPTTDFLSVATARSPFANPGITTAYSVMVTDSIGCISTSDVTVFVIEPYEWNDISEVACIGDTLQIELPLPDSFFVLSWIPAEPPLVIGNEDVDLTLNIADINGCFDDDYTFFVQSLSDSLIVPNIFSPNGDGQNDEFRVFTEIDLSREDLIRIEEFSVYNRWGQKVYSGSGPLAAWDGTNNDKPAPSDVYIYHIVVDILKADRVVEVRGQVTLVR